MRWGQEEINGRRRMVGDETDKQHLNKHGELILEPLGRSQSQELWKTQRLVVLFLPRDSEAADSFHLRMGKP